MRSFTFHAVAHFDIFTLSLHDALPISLMPFLMATASARMNSAQLSRKADPSQSHEGFDLVFVSPSGDRKSTRLNSSHRCISYAVFCLKKKKENKYNCLRDS